MNSLITECSKRKNVRKKPKWELINGITEQRNNMSFDFYLPPLYSILSI